MTIIDLLVSDGRWQNASGPRQNITNDFEINVELSSFRRDTWQRVERRTSGYMGKPKYSFSTWFYVPTQTNPDTIYQDDIHLSQSITNAQIDNVRINIATPWGVNLLAYIEVPHATTEL